MDEAKLVSYLLEKNEIILPTILLKQKIILDLEENLRKESPLSLRKFFKNISTNFDEYIDVSGIDKIFKLITEVSQYKNFQQCISANDEKIIDFLVKETKVENTEVLEIIGQQYFTFQVVDELEKLGNKLPKILKIALLMWCFVNIYELVLHEVDRRLLSYLKHKEYKNRDIRAFIKQVKRDEYKEHATAGSINKALCVILNLQEGNNSIFGKSAKPKLIRNKISHSNMFYDSEKNKIISLNGQEYSVKEFLDEYYRIFDFLFNWINGALNSKFSKEKIISDMKEYFKALSSEYLKIWRNGSLKKAYSGYIIKLKKEVGV